MVILKIQNFFLVFSALGWKSKSHFKSKGHSKSKGLKAFKGTKAKSYIHKGLAKRSAEPSGHYLKGDRDTFKGFSCKGKDHSLKGKCRIHVGLIKIIIENYLYIVKVITESLSDSTFFKSNFLLI